LRIAVVAEPPGGSTGAGIASAIRTAADVLAEAGHDVTEALPPSYEQAIAQWGALLAPDLEAQRPLIEAVIGDDGLRFLELTGERLAGFGTDGLPALFLDRYRIANERQQFFGRFDVLLTPTWTAPPFEHGFDIRSVDTAMTVLETIRPVLPANYLGLPAAVVPAAVVDGLPVGAQFTAARFADLTALAAAAALEAAVGTFTPFDPRSAACRSRDGGACARVPAAEAREEFVMSDLSSKRRENIPTKDFGLPEKARTKQAKKESGNYPMPDKPHARNAKARAAQQAKAGNLTKNERERIERKADKILDD
jgi:hypothetical protein